MLTDEQLAEMRGRCGKAASHSVIQYLRYDHGGGRAAVFLLSERTLVLDSYNEADREFDFNSRKDLPACLDEINMFKAKVLSRDALIKNQADEIDRLKAEVARLNLVVDSLENDVIRFSSPARSHPSSP